MERFVGDMLFNILILGTLVDESGYVFHRSDKDLFIIETTNPKESGNVCFITSTLKHSCFTMTEADKV